MYLKYFYQILLNQFWKYKIQNTFFQMYFKYKIHADRQLPFLSTVENVITVVVHNVKQSSEHTTQSLQFRCKQLNSETHRCKSSV